MNTATTSAEAIKLEIERLKGAINRAKTGGPVARPAVPATNATRPRGNVYVNPNYKPPSQAVRPPVSAIPSSRPASRPTPSLPQETRDVVIDGIAFESSGRTLVRKDLPKPAKPASATMTRPVTRPPAPHPAFMRNKAGTLMTGPRTYKPKTSARGRAMNRNMTLNNNRRPYQSRRLAAKKAKYSDKPCPRFTSTGSCNRGLTCMYQHDPNKIAICWPFLQGNCPHTAETCALSHDPTPQRTPLCVHFANNGRCTRANCLYPHVHVGAREGICRDFAVLGYCEKGLDCDKQHVRECPDFAEKGQCTIKGCKLPHVIRANRGRKAPSSTVQPPASTSTGSSSTATPSTAGSSSANSDTVDDTHSASSSRQITAEDGQLGDEFISLTFHESESEESDDDEEDEEEEEDDMDEVEEGQEPHSDDDDAIDVHA
ncbi:uncharacterized protein TRAVEDRAFT_47931 [Trametes versicolor FP-101664 SS1]|uniref:uncharacterized protein n=1 Tax=Trametes versicolor (strain FP-101664) TaxID=717944 RepID=UPI00046213E3|nr:uncharacterized protein TRAVEDRAFT_47931 [Trametes versicolor FP-101664 SS1]EIW58789.1 hypothetical protein TRAVEDRAFT_47931 [Trametes versicolor FP-101664 SS1]